MAQLTWWLLLPRRWPMVTMGDSRHGQEEERVIRTVRAHVGESGQLPVCASLRTPGMATRAHLDLLASHR